MNVYIRSDARPPGDRAPAADKAEVAAALKAELRGHRTFTRDELYKFGAAMDEITWSDEGPAYRSKWDLSKDPKLESGVIYMASLNSAQPACWTMLGLLAVHSHDKHLTIAAFEQAIRLGSDQAPILQAQIDLLKEHIAEARSHSLSYLIMPLVVACLVAIALLIAFKVLLKSLKS